MRIAFCRDSPGHHSVATRDDGVVVLVAGHDREHPVPRDIAHYVGETAFGVTDGFWGSVAAGAMFPGMLVLSGERRPHAGQRSRQVIKDNAAAIAVADQLAEVIGEAQRDGLDAAATLAMLRLQWSVPRTGHLPYDDHVVGRARALMASYATRWQNTPVGGLLAVNWPPGARCDPHGVIPRRRLPGGSQAGDRTAPRR